MYIGDRHGAPNAQRQRLPKLDLPVQPSRNGPVETRLSSELERAAEPCEVRRVGFRGLAVLVRVLQTVGVDDEVVDRSSPRVTPSQRAELIKQPLTFRPAASASPARGARLTLHGRSGLGRHSL